MPAVGVTYLGHHLAGRDTTPLPRIHEVEEIDAMHPHVLGVVIHLLAQVFKRLDHIAGAAFSLAIQDTQTDDLAFRGDSGLRPKSPVSLHTGFSTDAIASIFRSQLRRSER